MVLYSNEYMRVLESWKSINNIISNQKFSDIEFTQLNDNLCKLLDFQTDSVECTTIKKRAILLIQKVSNLYSDMPLIFKIANAKLQQKHWIIIANELKCSKILNNDFTCMDLLNSGLNKISYEIDGIIKETLAEYDIKKEIESIEYSIASLQFVVIKSKGEDIIGNFEQIFNAFSKSDSTLETLCQLYLEGNSTEKINEIRNEIKLYEKRAMLWAKSQKKWLDFKGFLKSDAIASHLPEQWKSFKTAYERLLHINQVVADNAFIKFQLGEWKEKELTEISHLIDEAEVGISNYIDSRRYSFPRYYFLSLTELLSIINEYNTQKSITSPIDYLFEGASTIYYGNTIPSLGPDLLEQELVSQLYRMRMK